MVVEHDDLADCPRVLQLQDRFLLDAEHDDVLAAHTNSTGTTTDCLKRILNLQRRSVSE